MSTVEAPLSSGHVRLLSGEGRGEREGFDGLPSLGAGFPCGDELLRSPTRHNAVLYLQDGLFAHSDCLGCYSSRLVQGYLLPGRFVSLGDWFFCSGYCLLLVDSVWVLDGLLFLVACSLCEVLP